MPKKNVKVKIQSHMSDLTNADMMRTVIDDKGVMSVLNAEEIIDDKVEFSTNAVLKDNGGKIELVYDELEELGMEKSRTRLIFNKDEPTVVTMLRTGSVSTGMVFDSDKKGRRHMCTYNTGFMPIELCICTRNIDNTLTYDSGGTVYLDYEVEFHGIKTERNRFTIEVTNQRQEGKSV